jgi:hypothetical protein
MLLHLCNCSAKASEGSVSIQQQQRNLLASLPHLHQAAMPERNPEDICE